MSQPDFFEMEWGNINEKHEIEVDAIFMFQEIEKQLSEVLLEEKGKKDSTDGAFSFIENLTNNIQTGFDKIIGESDEKKQFIRSLMRIFTILLNTKVDSVEKIKKMIKIVISTTLKLWSGQN